MKNKELKFLEMRILNSLIDTENFAMEFASKLKSKFVLGLQGEMGSGKTHFVKSITKYLGCSSEQVNSPSYAIHQEYLGKELNVEHIDLYRLESSEEIEASGFWDLFYNQNSIIVIEWVDRIDQSQIPQSFSYFRLEWKILNETTREVQIFSRE